MLVLAHAEEPTNSSDTAGARGQDKMSTSFPAFLIKQFSVQAILILENNDQDSGLQAKMASDAQYCILKTYLTGLISAWTLVINRWTA